MAVVASAGGEKGESETGVRANDGFVSFAFSSVPIYVQGRSSSIYSCSSLASLRSKLTSWLVAEGPARARRGLARERVHVETDRSRRARGGRVLKGVRVGVEDEICRSRETLCAQRLTSVLGDFSRVASLALSLPGFIQKLADTAPGARARRSLPLADPLPARAALDALFQVVEPGNGAVATFWAAHALRRIADDGGVGIFAGIAGRAVANLSVRVFESVDV